MKKIFFIAALMMTCTIFSFAQIDQEELRIEMDKMEQEMSHAFKLLELTLQDGRLFEGMDTLMFKMIPDMDQESTETYPNGDPYQLHHLMDQLMGSFSEENRADLELFFKDFEQRLPAPEEFEEWKEEGDIEQDPSEPSQKQGNTSKKKRKKKKIYRM